MPSAWLQVPLADYEGHMSAPQVAQLEALSELFGEALAFCKPASVAIAGIAGGNGLDRIDPAITRRVAGLDVCQDYLDAVRERYPRLPLELHCADLASSRLAIEPADLVHAALILEHAGMDLCLDNVLSFVKPGGTLAVVLQLPSSSAAGVAPTGFDSLQTLAPHFRMIDPAAFIDGLSSRGFLVQSETRRPVASGKAFWMGLFRRTSS